MNWRCFCVLIWSHWRRPNAPRVTAQGAGARPTHHAAQHASHHAAKSTPVAAAQLVPFDDDGGLAGF